MCIVTKLPAFHVYSDDIGDDGDNVYGDGEDKVYGDVDSRRLSPMTTPMLQLLLATMGCKSRNFTLSRKLISYVLYMNNVHRTHKIHLKFHLERMTKSFILRAEHWEMDSEGQIKHTSSGERMMMIIVWMMMMTMVVMMIIARSLPG